LQRKLACNAHNNAIADIFAGQFLPGVVSRADDARNPSRSEAVQKQRAERRKHFCETNCQSRICIL
jgi:hypothetical protein